MINVCIVEDDLQQAKILENYIHRYAEERGVQFAISQLPDGIDLVDDYRSQYDIVLLDIQMKHMNGMEAAEKVRAVDPELIIIFITSTVQYAVQGYAVDALGYVLKPVPYPQFAQLLDKACARIQTRNQHVYIRVTSDDKKFRLDCSRISYIESQRNNVILHSSEEDYVTAGPLKKYEEMLGEHGFCKCHNAYVVNLSYVEAIRREEVLLTDGSVVPISRGRKKEFMSALAEGMI